MLVFDLPGTTVVALANVLLVLASCCDMVALCLAADVCAYDVVNHVVSCPRYPSHGLVIAFQY